MQKTAILSQLTNRKSCVVCEKATGVLSNENVQENYRVYAGKAVLYAEKSR